MFAFVVFQFFGTKPRDWLGRTFPKWSILCRVGHKASTQSVAVYLHRAEIHDLCQGSFSLGLFVRWFGKGLPSYLVPPTSCWHINSGGNMAAAIHKRNIQMYNRVLRAVGKAMRKSQHRKHLTSAWVIPVETCTEPWQRFVVVKSDYLFILYVQCRLVSYMWKMMGK